MPMISSFEKISPLQNWLASPSCEPADGPSHDGGGRWLEISTFAPGSLINLETKLHAL